jgi:hypothetical protein
MKSEIDADAAGDQQLHCGMAQDQNSGRPHLNVAPRWLLDYLPSS